MHDKTIILKKNQRISFIWAFLFLIISTQLSTAQTSSDSTEVRFGSPSSVQGQEAEDAMQNKGIIEVDKYQNYIDWKGRFKEKSAITYTIDYTSAFLAATNTLNNDNFFASGAIRFFGSWSPVGRKSGNTGSFIWKIEHRHKYTSVGANGTASEIGYAGIILPVLSNIGLRLTNLYWKQNLLEGRIEIIGGFIDVTDWVDVYAFASPWNGFFNLVQATGVASMFLPDDATIGLYINALLTKHIYIIAGLSDANSISTDPFKGFETFFNDNEYFTSIELGWIRSQNRFYFNNTHLTFWHVDERVNAGVSEAWGLNLSISHTFDLKWMPYLRAGFSSAGGGWFLQKSVSAGLGFHLNDLSLFGMGFNWSQPNEDTYGGKLNNQFATEVFCRLQVLRNIEISPNLQWIIQPALNTKNNSWLLGMRGRLFF